MSDLGALRDPREPLSIEDFLAKIEWEGGVDEAIDYGLVGSDCANRTLGEIWDRAYILGHPQADIVIGESSE